jgi:hypothetical protein
MDRLKWCLVVVAVICVLDLTVTSIIEQGTSLKFLYRAKLCLDLLSGPVSLLSSMLLEDGVTALIWVFLNPLILACVGLGVAGIYGMFKGKIWGLPIWLLSGALAILNPLAFAV